MRALAVIGTVVTIVATTGLASSPAHAAGVPAPIAKVVVPSVTLAPSFSDIVPVTLVGSPGAAIVLDHATLTMDTTEFTKYSANVNLEVGDNPCPKNNGVVTCRLPDQAHEPGTVSPVQATFATLASVPVGQVVTIQTTLSADGMAPVTGISTVTIGETVKLDGVRDADRDIHTVTGVPVTVPTGVRNTGTVPINGVTLWVKGTYGLDFDKQYSNCRYNDTADMFCVFDATLTPGTEYTPAEPITVTAPADTPLMDPFGYYGPGHVFGRFTWNTPADAERDLAAVDWSTFHQGQGTPLGLTVRSSTAAKALAIKPATQPTLRQTNDELGGYNYNDVNIYVSGVNGWNLVAGGVAVSGTVGAIVNARVTVTNATLAAIPNEVPNEAWVVVTIPAGTTAVSVPNSCFADVPVEQFWRTQAKPGAARYRCRLANDVLHQGDQRTWDFGLRIDRPITDATGTVEVDRTMIQVTEENPYDIDVTDDRAAIVVNPSTPGPWTGGSGLTDGPAVIPFPGPHQSDTAVMANAGGNLVMKRWSTRVGWWLWHKVGGDITGEPAPLGNPDNGDLEVYANSGGHLVRQRWDSSRQEWPELWADLGSGISGSPAALFNPNNHNVEVYANANGHVVETYRGSTATSWSGLGDLGGDVTGKPMAFYNPGNHNIEIYANSHGHLVEKYWNARNGQWSGWNNLGGNFVGDPTVLFDPNNGNIEVYANAQGNLVEKYWNSHSGQWSDWNNLGGPIGGAPSALYDPNNRNIEIFANSHGHLVEKFWNAGNGRWSEWNDLGGQLSGDPTAYSNERYHNVEIYGIDARRLTEKYWNSATGEWSDWKTF